MKLYPHPITGRLVQVHFTKVHFTQRELNSIEVEILLLALAKEFQNSFFSICGIDQAFSHMGINHALKESVQYKNLHTLHCVHYSSMSKELRMQIPDLCFGLLGLSFSTPVEIIEEPRYESNYTKYRQTAQPDPEPVKSGLKLKFWK